MKRFWEAYDHFLVTTTTWEWYLAMTEMAMIGLSTGIAISMRAGLY